MFDWLLFLYGGVDFEGESIQEKLFVFLRNVSLHFSRTKGGTKTLTLVNPALPSPSTPTHPFSSSLFFSHWDCFSSDIPQIQTIIWHTKNHK